MAKSKLRIIFNTFLVVFVLGYGTLLLFTDFGNAKRSIIYVIIFVIISLTRDIIAPKQKIRDTDGNN